MSVPRRPPSIGTDALDLPGQRLGPERSRRLLGLAALACLLAAAPAAAQLADLQREDRRWVESIDPSQGVRVVNPRGNVYARFGGYEGEVEILATLQRLDAERSGLTVSVGRTATALNVSVSVAESPDNDSPTRERADLVVFVPKDAALEIRTRDGAIEVKGIRSDLVASSLSGDLRIRSVAGRVQAKTARGRIAAVLEAGATDQAQSLTTETGEIEVYLAEDARHDVAIATSGEISTDFSITIEHRPQEEPGKHASASVVGGGPELTLWSKRGRIRLLRLQKNFGPATD